MEYLVCPALALLPCVAHLTGDHRPDDRMELAEEDAANRSVAAAALVELRRAVGGDDGGGGWGRWQRRRWRRNGGQHDNTNYLFDSPASREPPERWNRVENCYAAVGQRENCGGLLAQCFCFLRFHVFAATAMVVNKQRMHASLRYEGETSHLSRVVNVAFARSLLQYM